MPFTLFGIKCLFQSVHAKFHQIEYLESVKQIESILVIYQSWTFIKCRSMGNNALTGGVLTVNQCNRTWKLY